MFRFLVWIIRWTWGFFAKDQCAVGESIQLWLQTAHTASQFSTLSQLVLCFRPEEPLTVFSGSSCHPLGQIRLAWELPGYRFLSFSSLQPFIKLFGFIVLIKGSYHRVQSPSFILSFFGGGCSRCLSSSLSIPIFSTAHPCFSSLLIIAQGTSPAWGPTSSSACFAIPGSHDSRNQLRILFGGGWFGLNKQARKRSKNGRCEMEGRVKSWVVPIHGVIK